MASLMQEYRITLTAKAEEGDASATRKVSIQSMKNAWSLVEETAKQTAKSDGKSGHEYRFTVTVTEAEGGGQAKRTILLLARDNPWYLCEEIAGWVVDKLANTVQMEMAV